MAQEFAPLLAFEHVAKLLSSQRPLRLFAMVAGHFAGCTIGGRVTAVLGMQQLVWTDQEYRRRTENGEIAPY
jgi:hypothetical protein